MTAWQKVSAASYSTALRTAPWKAGAVQSRHSVRAGRQWPNGPASAWASYKLRRAAAL